MVIGTDAHYLKKEDRWVHKAYLNSKGGEREVDSFYEFAYLQDENQIKENLTPSIVDAYDWMCQNSMEIYNKIENYSLQHSSVIPGVEVKDYPKKKYKVIIQFWIVCIIQMISMKDIGLINVKNH